MEVKVGFDRDKLLEWHGEHCGMDCEDCPLDGYMCETLLKVVHKEKSKGDE